MRNELPTSSDAPVRNGEEWANATTHALASLATLILGGFLIVAGREKSVAMGIACAVYTVSVFGTFLASTLSHAVQRQPLLDRFRSWDQAMIYAMISGTYTPIIFRFASPEIRPWLLAAIWIAAAVGIAGKLFLRHRINNVATLGYLLLGWCPSIPLYGSVPAGLGWGMLLGGVLYSGGVVVLFNDHRAPYLHAVWHLLVVSAAFCHFLSIQWFVVS
ncbi:MAG: hemolysin III family protein [Planctomycetota bacterium]